MRRSGDYRDLGQIQKLPSRELDAVGQPVLDWTTVATRWMKVEPSSGREIITEQGELAEVTTKIELDYFKGLDNTMRILIVPQDGTGDGAYYNIKHVLDVKNRHITMLAYCGSGVVVNV